MNNTTHPEIKSFIEIEAKKRAFKRYDEENMMYQILKEETTKAMTSLYQHLQENGRVAELEKDYEVVKKDHDRLVRELDVIINGEEGAAKQASLCDIVSQLKNKKIVLYDK